MAERVVSLANLSAQLIDAFMESDGKHSAVVFSDRSRDIAPMFDVLYDKDRKCIIIELGYTDHDIDTSSIRKQIAEVNGE